MDLEKLDEIYQSLKSADDHAREHGLPFRRTPSILLIETLIANNPKDYATYVLRSISSRLEAIEPHHPTGLDGRYSLRRIAEILGISDIELEERLEAHLNAGSVDLEKLEQPK